MEKKNNFDTDTFMRRNQDDVDEGSMNESSLSVSLRMWPGIIMKNIFVKQQETGIAER